MPILSPAELPAAPSFKSGVFSGLSVIFLAFAIAVAPVAGGAFAQNQDTEQNGEPPSESSNQQQSEPSGQG